MVSTYYRIIQFIKDERDELEAGESNYFGLVFGEAEKYYAYLMLVWPRYKAISKVYVQTTRGRWAGTVSWEEVREFELSIGRQLHLELETIFIFSSILLDRIAACTQYYFGPGSQPWRSFRSMNKHLEGYCRNRGLPAPNDKMIEVMQWLYKNVSEFRHLLVVHKHEDYRVRFHFGTGWSNDDDEAYFNLGLMDPQGNEQPLLSSEKPQDILNYLNQFLEQWVEYLCSNRDKRNLSPNA